MGGGGLSLIFENIFSLITIKKLSYENIFDLFFNAIPCIYCL